MRTDAAARLQQGQSRLTPRHPDVSLHLYLYEMQACRQQAITRLDEFQARGPFGRDKISSRLDEIQAQL